MTKTVKKLTRTQAIKQKGGAQVDLRHDVLAAIHELNKALQAAHECAEMRVFLAQRPRSSERAMQFEPQIFRMTHSTLTFVITPAVQTEMPWRHVKDAQFQEAAGNGFAALDRKDKHAKGVSGAS